MSENEMINAVLSKVDNYFDDVILQDLTKLLNPFSIVKSNEDYEAFEKRLDQLFNIDKIKKLINDELEIQSECKAVRCDVYEQINFEDLKNTKSIIMKQVERIERDHRQLVLMPYIMAMTLTIMGVIAAALDSLVDNSLLAILMYLFMVIYILGVSTLAYIIPGISPDTLGPVSAFIIASFELIFICFLTTKYIDHRKLKRHQSRVGEVAVKVKQVFLNECRGVLASLIP